MRRPCARPIRCGRHSRTGSSFAASIVLREICLRMEITRPRGAWIRADRTVRAAYSLLSDATEAGKPSDEEHCGRGDGGLATVSMSLVLVGCSSATKTDKPATHRRRRVPRRPRARRRRRPPRPPVRPRRSTTTSPRTTSPRRRSSRTSPAHRTSTFPFPPGWSLAGDKTPAGLGYGAIVYDKPEDPEGPARDHRDRLKLTGDVDPAKILQYAPNQLLNLPDFKPIGEPENVKMSGFDAIQSAGRTPTTASRGSSLRRPS